MDGVIEKTGTVPAQHALQVEQIDPRTFALAGDLDLSTVRELEVAVAGEVYGKGPLVLDLAGLNFIDSGGLSAVIRIARRLKDELVLRNPNPVVERALWLTGIGHDPRFGVRIEGGEPQPVASEIAPESDFLRPDSE
jgi:anti-anti-sigma factor